MRAIREGEVVTRTITLYRDSPVWERYDRWFQVPLADLESLFIGRWEICGEWVADAEVERAAAVLRADHPGAVLVY